ncbi:MAG: iron-sulfur cluster-binding protein [Bacteroidetes bacterium]|nr:iron-sulfur cluster-binding protein [Bacteroidota bacterium]HET6242932.1 LutB/LldF family L-lactate oxidation iron-sulfur protein [Bacteroidia bacterium]
MAPHLDSFLIASKKAFDLDHRKKLNFNISKYDHSVVLGKEQYSNLDLAKTRAAHLKNKVIDNLEKYLIEFEANFTKKGGKVIWAQDTEEALKEVFQILEKHNTKIVVKSKSMVTEEIGLNKALEKRQIETVETDLGEYIQQLDGEPPYHIVTPAMHKSKEDVAKLFHEKFNLPLDSSPADITAYVREKLRDKFRTAQAGITGANFLIADSGAIAITENEGNALMSMAFPKVHIAIAGIEKLIPSTKDLDLFWPLLATHGTGQNLTVYNTIINGPRQAGETDGPEEMYVILLDNGRTNLLAQPEQRRALSCIRCGACLNACPVYKNIGGHSYGTTYSGPIGAVIMPHLEGMEKNKHLSFASSLCGKCTEVCPVKIELHKMLLYNRKDSVKQSLSTKSENWSMFFWKAAMLKRSTMEKGGANLKNFMLKRLFKKAWGEKRDLPKIAPKSFNQIWKEKK